ncbi:MAG: hypothetical protein U0354_19630 [Candidatus Sericytochromatia bacterium]
MISTSTLTLEQRTDNKTTIQPFYLDGNGNANIFGSNFKEAKGDSYALRPLYLVSDSTGSNVVNINNNNSGNIEVKVTPIFKASFSDSTDIEKNRLNSATIIKDPGSSYEGVTTINNGYEENQVSDCTAITTLGHPRSNNKTMDKSVLSSKTTQEKGSYFTDISFNSWNYSGEPSYTNHYAGNMMFDQIKSAIGTAYNSSSFNHFQQVPYYADIKRATKVFLLAGGKSGFHSLINPNSNLFIMRNTVDAYTGTHSEGLVSCQTYVLATDVLSLDTVKKIVLNEVGNDKIHLAYSDYMSDLS